MSTPKEMQEAIESSSSMYGDKKAIVCYVTIALGLMSYIPASYMVILGAVLAAALLYILRRKPADQASSSQVIVITGCDSGLGYSLAIFAHKVGFTVVATCLRPDGEGARNLKHLCGKGLHILPLDLRSQKSVQETVSSVRSLLDQDDSFRLRALVNNAGVMVFGEFEWLTDAHVNHQVDVNFLGTIRLTKAFSSLIRKHKARIITVTSHCGLSTLPGLAVYGATKAALQAWSDGLRVEQAKFGVRVITFVPGSFFQYSNLMAQQDRYLQEMEEAMSSEDKTFYSNYFQTYCGYLKAVTSMKMSGLLKDKKVYSNFYSALLSHQPCSYYETAPLRYRWYHFLFKISPTSLRDYFILKFTQAPAWH